MDWRAPTAIGIVTLAAIGLAFWALSGTSTDLDTPERVRRTASQVDPVRRRVTRPAPLALAVAEADEEEEFIPLEEDPSIPVVTTKCKELVEKQRKGVLDMHLMDRVRDGGMRFDKDDLLCMERAGAKPGLMELAEHHRDWNADRGVVGTPGRNRKLERRRRAAEQ